MDPSAQHKRIGIVGSGPAGLMAADVLASAGHEVLIFEKRKGPAWKLFIAGGSGLNITNDLPLDAFASHYTGPSAFWQECLRAYGPKDWLAFIEDQLAIGTFLGTSGRYFVETMHAAKLVRQWRRRLESLGVKFILDAHCVDFESVSPGWHLSFANKDLERVDAVCFCLGGGSYETSEVPLAWPAMFVRKSIGFRDFSPSNTGYEVDWTPGFLAEAEGLPLKNICLRSSRGQRKGDLVITHYGLEGTPIYFLGETGEVTLDLKPDLSEAALLDRLQQGRENLSPMRRAQKYLQLCPAAKALLFHHSPKEALKDPCSLARMIKNFPLRLQRPRPLSESISSQGGLLWENFDEQLMLSSHPGVYCAGEMIDWDAPTGGFLIQACISQGHRIAEAILRRITPPASAKSH